MVGKAYLLEKPPRASTLKPRFDQAVIPAALNAVAPIEAALYRVSERARARPVAALALAIAAGFLVPRLVWEASRRRDRSRASA